MGEKYNSPSVGESRGKDSHTPEVFMGEAVMILVLEIVGFLIASVVFIAVLNYITGKRQ